MCFAMMAAAATVVGTALSAVGAISEGNAAAGASRDAAKMQAYQAQVSRNNATIAEQNATRAESVATAQAQAKSMEAAARLGKVKAAQAASGIDVNTGSNVDVQVGTRELGKLDTDTVFSNELVKAYGYRSTAANYQAESELAMFREKGLYDRASSQETSGWLKAGGTVLSNLSSLPMKWPGDPDAEQNLSGFSRGGGPTGPSGAY